MTAVYIAPALHLAKFTCPLCDTVAQQTWYNQIGLHKTTPPQALNTTISEMEVSGCASCNRYIFWFKDRIFAPIFPTQPHPSEGMPAEVKRLYVEAGNTYHYSYPASAALARLSLQHLVRHLGKSGENLHAEVVEIAHHHVPDVAQILTGLGVTGEKAIHPGTIEAEENPEHIQKLFTLINVLVEVLIKGPNEAKALFANVTESSPAA